MSRALRVAVVMPLLVILTVMGIAFHVAIMSMVTAPQPTFTSLNAAWISLGTSFP
jgi:hypothetical protein